MKKDDGTDFQGGSLRTGLGALTRYLKETVDYVSAFVGSDVVYVVDLDGLISVIDFIII